MTGVRTLGVAALLVAVTVVPTCGIDPAELVARVQVRYDETADFTADVRQEVIVASAGKTLTAQGTVAFKRPGKMRWTLANHERQVIVADGQTLWFYQPDEQQVLRAPFRSAFRSTTPISFLTGVGRIAEDFEASVERQEGPLVYLRLVPRRAEPEVGRLILRVDSSSHDITGAETHDVFGNITRIAFDRVRRNTGLADEIFDFEIPSGVDIIDAPIGY